MLFFKTRICNGHLVVVFTFLFKPPSVSMCFLFHFCLNLNFSVFSPKDQFTVVYFTNQTTKTVLSETGIRLSKARG